MYKQAIFAFALLAILISSGLGYPTFPGNCPLNMAACTGHIKAVPNAKTGRLSVKGFALSIDGKNLTEGGTVNLKVNRTHTLKLAGNSFRGFLIRANVASLAIKAGTNSGIAAACGTTAAGIGHINPTVKKTASGTLTLSTVKKGIALDVTVVVIFNQTEHLSEYYYSSFKINAVA